jgi:hypothetical protein
MTDKDIQIKSKLKFVRILMLFFLGCMIILLVLFAFSDQLIFQKTKKTRAFVYNVSHFHINRDLELKTHIVVSYRVDGEFYLDTIIQDEGDAFPLEGDSIRIRYFVENPSECEIISVFPF